MYLLSIGASCSWKRRLHCETLCCLFSDSVTLCFWIKQCLCSSTPSNLTHIHTRTQIDRSIERERERESKFQGHYTAYDWQASSSWTERISATEEQVGETIVEEKGYCLLWLAPPLCFLVSLCCFLSSLYTDHFVDYTPTCYDLDLIRFKQHFFGFLTQRGSILPLEDLTVSNLVRCLFARRNLGSSRVVIAGD